MIEASPQLRRTIKGRKYGNEKSNWTRDHFLLFGGSRSEGRCEAAIARHPGEGRDLSKPDVGWIFIVQSV
jgi:hypothetical protein